MIHLRDDQVLDHVVAPVLGWMSTDNAALASPAAQQLVIGTALVESNLDYIEQIGGGPALGFWQMEPATHNDIWTNYLDHRPHLARRVEDFMIDGLSGLEQLAGNLYYGCAMCRVHYWRVSDPLPAAGDIAGLGAYWKEHYNTAAGAGTIDKFVEAWARFNP